MFSMRILFFFCSKMMKLRLVHEKFDAVLCFALLCCRSRFTKDFFSLRERSTFARERKERARDETETIHT